MPYKRKDSRFWWVDLTDASGKRVRRSTGTTDRKEAEGLEAKWKLETFKQQQWDEQPSRTFDEVMLPYLNETMHRRRQGEHRVRTIAKPLFRAFTGANLNELRMTDIRSYIRERRSIGRAASTINKEIGLLSAAINYARREWGWDIPNPVAGCRQKEPEGRLRWITREEAERLIRAASRNSRAPHLVDFIRLALHTGCRRGELLHLEWHRVDLDSKLVFFEPEHTKTGKRRYVPLNKEASQAIVDRMRFRNEHCANSPWVFCDKKGNRITDLKHSFTSACQHAGIKDYLIHDMRHTCAAWLVSAGVPLAEVRDLLGHSTIKMTERYAHLAPENVRAAVAKLDAPVSRFCHVPRLRVVEGGTK